MKARRVPHPTRCLRTLHRLKSLAFRDKRIRDTDGMWGGYPEAGVEERGSSWCLRPTSSRPPTVNSLWASLNCRKSGPRQRMLPRYPEQRGQQPPRTQACHRSTSLLWRTTKQALRPQSNACQQRMRNASFTSAAAIARAVAITSGHPSDRRRLARAEGRAYRRRRGQDERAPYEADGRCPAASAARSRINRCTSCSRPLADGVCTAWGRAKGFFGGAGTGAADGRATVRVSFAASEMPVLIRLP